MTGKLALDFLRDYASAFFRPGNLLTVPAVLDKPEGRRVAVLAPHMDDEVIGCGGTIRKHVLSGDDVSVVYFTDGREGDPLCDNKDLAARNRRAEAERAGDVLGIGRRFFLEEPETNLRSTKALRETLCGILREIDPDLMYIPSFLENHVDHLAVNRILLDIAGKIGTGFRIAAYEVWTPLLPNVLVDLSPVLDCKREAIRQYASQLRYVDYEQAALGLNRYRSIHALQGRCHAEAFLLLTATEYLGLLRRLRLPRRHFLSRESRERIRSLLPRGTRGRGPRGERPGSPP